MRLTTARTAADGASPGQPELAPADLVPPDELGPAAHLEPSARAQPPAAATGRGLLRAILHTLGTILVGQAAQILAGIATARAFGPSGKGVISYTGIFAAFGIAAVEGLRSAIGFQYGNERQAIGRVWRTALGPLTLIAGGGTLTFLGLWLHDGRQLAFLFVALAFPFAAYLQTVNVVYLLRGAIERINTQNAWTVGAGSSLVTIAALALFHVGLIAVLVIWVFGYVAAALVATLALPRLLRAEQHAGAVPAAAPSLLPQQARFAVTGGLSAAVTLLAVRIDCVIVGAMLGPASLGLYATALAVAELLYTLSRSMTWATTGRITTEPRPLAVALAARVIRVLLATQGLTALALFIAGPFAIDLLYGGRFAGAGLLLRIVLARTVVYSVDGVVSSFIAVRAGRPGVLFAFELGTLALCATLTGLAVRPFGLTGAAVAATVSFILAFAIKLAYFARIAPVGPRDLLVVRPEDIPARVRARLGWLGLAPRP